MSNIVKLKNPLDCNNRQIVPVEHELTIEQIRNLPEVIDTFASEEDVVVSVCGQIIPKEQWPYRIIHTTEFVLIVPNVGDDVFKTILLISLIVIAPYAAGALLPAGVFGIAGTLLKLGITAAIILGGGILINTLSPHPSLPSPEFKEQNELSQSYGWSPQTVQRQGIPIPRFYGRFKLEGNVIQTYRQLTDPISNKQDLYCLICLGDGPFFQQIIDGTVKLNDQIMENFDDVFIETRYGELAQSPISFLSGCRFEAVPFIFVSSEGSKTYETNSYDFDNLIIVLTFPIGLYNSSGGSVANYTVNVTIEVKKTTSGAWQELITTNITDATTDKVIREYPTAGVLNIERGFKYQVRVTKNTADKNNSYYGDDLYLESVIEITDEAFIYPGRTLIGIKALATEQLSGSIRFSCHSLCKYVRVYDGVSWEITFSKNNAWIAFDILTQPVYSGSHSPWRDLLLLLHLNGTDAATTTLDSSEHGHAVVFNGTAQLDTTQKKFGTAALLLDGNSDYLSFLYNVLWNILYSDTDDIVIDFFARHTDHVGTETYVTQYEDSANYWAIFHYHGGGLRFLFKLNGANIVDTRQAGEIADVIPTWHHVALCKIADEIGLYLDGVQKSYFKLSFKEAWEKLKLLLHFTGSDGATNTIDSSNKNHTITFAGTAQIDSGVQKFTTTLLLDGDSDCISSADSDDWNICASASDDWTLDFFAKHDDHVGTEVYICQVEDANNYWKLYHTHGSGLRFILVSGGNIIIDTGLAGEIADTNWHHIALCKKGSKYGIYKDGVLVAYTDDSSNDVIDGPLCIGADPANFFDGNIDEVRIMNYNFFGANPDVGLTDTIVVPTAAYSKITLPLILDGPLHIGAHSPSSYFDGHIDEFRMIRNNIFDAAPNVGLTDTIVVPTGEYSDPGNSFEIERYDCYDPSKIDLPAFKDLSDWCDEQQVNPVNFAISGISLALKAIVTTTSSHNFLIGDTVVFRGVSSNGMVELTDGTIATVLQIINENNFVIDLDTSGYTAYQTKDKLLFNFDGEDGQKSATDLSPQGHNAAAENFLSDAQLDTAVKKWGSASLELDGDYDALYLSPSPDWELVASVSEIWTVSFFVKHDTHADTQVYLTLYHTTHAWRLVHIHGTGIRFYNLISGVAKLDTVGGGEIADTNWHHIAVIKNGANVGVYKDGIQVGYDLMVDDDKQTYDNFLMIGKVYQYIWELDGHIDDLKITNSNPFNGAPNVGKTNTITVPTGAQTISQAGTVETYMPRFEFNGGFDTATDPWTAALQVCEQCRAVLFWKGSKISVAIDKAKESVYAFTVGNIVENSFKGNLIPLQERAGEIEAHFKDAARDYERREISPSSNAIINNPQNKIRMDLFGITSEDIVNRLIEFRLLKNEHIKHMVQFGVDVDAICVTIGDAVDIQSDVSNWGEIGELSEDYTGGGRVVSATNGPNAIVTVKGKLIFLDADWEGGSTVYKMMIKTKGDTIERKTIIGYDSSMDQITVSGAFTNCPQEDDIWSAGKENFETKKFLVENIQLNSMLQADILFSEYKDELYVND